MAISVIMLDPAGIINFATNINDANVTASELFNPPTSNTYAQAAIEQPDIVLDLSSGGVGAGTRAYGFAS